MVPGCQPFLRNLPRSDDNPTLKRWAIVTISLREKGFALIWRPKILVALTVPGRSNLYTPERVFIFKQARCRTCCARGRARSVTQWHSRKGAWSNVAERGTSSARRNADAPTRIRNFPCVSCYQRVCGPGRPALRPCGSNRLLSRKNFHPLDMNNLQRHPVWLYSKPEITTARDHPRRCLRLVAMVQSHL